VNGGPPDAHAPVSVVICSRDRAQMLARCVESVMAALGPEDELIVVDSASNEAAATAAAVGNGDARVRLLRAEQPGASLARNLGWRSARHAIVAFLDDDVWVDTGWCAAFAAAADRHPELAFFTGRIDVPPDQAGTSRPVALKDESQAHAIERETTGTVGHSASLAVRRDALASIGGFDELLGAGARYHAAEDADLFDRLLLAGDRGRFEPAARAWHDQWRKRDELIRLDWRYGIGSGARLRKLFACPTERSRARRIARTLLWDGGVRQAGRDLRSGWQAGFAMKMAGVAGTTWGFLRAWLATTVVGGHLRPRRARR